MRVRIEKLVAGGDGLARSGDGIVLVPDAAPGDLLEVTVTATRGGYRRASASRIVEPGPGRRRAPCPVAAECGGCSWQHLDYDTQVEAKRAILLESFRRIGKLARPVAVRVHRSAEWGYRRRARFQVDHRPDGTTSVGFHARGADRVVAIAGCPVLTPRLDALLAALPAMLSKGGQRARTVSAIDAADGPELALEPRAMAAPAAARRSRPTVSVGGRCLQVTPGGFFQANAPLLDALVGRVVELACDGLCGTTAEAAAFDLYAGVGLFTLALGDRFREVVAVEGDPAAAACLHANVEASSGVCAAQTSVEAFVERAAARLADQVVVVDPPRAGLGRRVRRALIAQPPRRLVYVGCDPVALARDVGELARAGFQLGQVDLFDLFPQTHHMEVVVGLDAAA